MKTAVGIASIVGALATGYNAVQTDTAQRKGRAMQKTANQQAQNAALKQEQSAEDAVRRANKQQPDIAALLADAQGPQKPATMLTGTTGNTLLGM